MVKLLLEKFSNKLRDLQQLLHYLGSYRRPLSDAFGEGGYTNAQRPHAFLVKVLAEVTGSCQYMLLKIYNIYLRADIFLARWMIASLVLRSTRKTILESSSSFSPLCLLGKMGKTMEKLFRSRLQQVTRAAENLSDH